MAFSTEDFVQDLRDTLCEEDFEAEVESFLQSHASVVSAGVRAAEDGGDGSGFDFAVDAVYKSYLGLVEGHLARFMRAHSMTATQCRDRLERAQDSGGGLLVRMMISSWEFDSFVELCRDHVEEHGDGGGIIDSKSGGAADVDSKFGGDGGGGGGGGGREGGEALSRGK